MNDKGRTWALVLAAGEGTRLRQLTTNSAGVAIPKQFCSLRGGPSLLHEALRRAESVATRERICTVVSRDHRRWWAAELEGMAPDNVIVQPQNKGTAIGILLPLLHIVEKDPQACVVMLPSDHHVRDEQKLSGAIADAIARLAAHGREMIFLGVDPEDLDPDLGYIVPGRDDGRGMRTVERFVEKPPVGTVRRLIRDGALWNAFIIATRAQTFLDLFATKFPEIFMAMRESRARDCRATAQSSAVRDLYPSLPVIDFSRDVVQGSEQTLRVLTVPHCGWSDLGTPARVARVLEHLPAPHAWNGDHHVFRWGDRLSLAAQQAQTLAT